MKFLHIPPMEKKEAWRGCACRASLRPNYGCPAPGQTTKGIDTAAMIERAELLELVLDSLPDHGTRPGPRNELVFRAAAEGIA